MKSVDQNTKNRRKNLYFIGITLILLLLGIGGSIYVLKSQASHCVAYIYQHGELLQTIDLDAVTEAYTFDIVGENDAINTVSVKPGEIAITKASCPDKVCVNVGYIHNDKLPITCMPNQVMIKLETPHSVAPQVDGATY